ncbi:MAG: hypothetical protein AB7N61_20615 [Acidimicrobiia bacterium]
MNEATLPGEARFWDLAEPLLLRPEVTRSTMMGLPCLRWNGVFFASCDRRNGDLLVKLTDSRVDELIAAGQAHPFAPAGRRFREWSAVPVSRSRSWKRLLDEALVVAIAHPAPVKKKR